MKHDAFALRLAYLRWLDGIGRVVPEPDRQFAKRVGVGYEWLKKWMRRDDAPNDRVATKRLVEALKADADWLLDGLGEAPEPALWGRWVSGARAVAESHLAGPTQRKGRHPPAQIADTKLYRPVPRPSRRDRGKGRRLG